MTLNAAEDGKKKLKDDVEVVEIGHHVTMWGEKTLDQRVFILFSRCL